MFTVRRETIRALAEGNRYAATFDSVKKQVILRKSEEPAPRNDLEELFDGIRRELLTSGRKKFTADERELILEVVRVLVS